MHMQNVPVRTLSGSLPSKNIVDLNTLVRQLKGQTFAAPGPKKWRAIVAQKDVAFFAAEHNARIIGMAILRWHELPEGIVGTIDDVVVHKNFRGQGYGTYIMNAIERFARRKGIMHIDLTSRPSRTEANRLYKKLGWKKRKTNIYRLPL
jgi:ribosomal protein S18 acetylase RimI-like enzyme